MFEANALWPPVIGRAPIPFGQRVQKAGDTLPSKSGRPLLAPMIYKDTIMKILMSSLINKRYLLVAVLIALTSTYVSARGGGQGFGGFNAISKAQLEATWNGQAGPQHTAIRGVRVQWYADICGNANGHVKDAKDCVNNTKQKKETEVSDTH